MTLDDLLPCFDSCAFQHRGDNYFAARAVLAGRAVTLLGSEHGAYVGFDVAVELARAVRQCQDAGVIVFLIDSRGQKLSRRDESLGLFAAMANLAESIDAAKRRGVTVLGVVYGQAVSGGFLATGLMAHKLFAMQGAQLSVMNRPAMARITKLPEIELEQLATTSPVFGDRPAQHWAMGALDEVLEDVAALRRRLLQELASDPALHDQRAEAGRERGGRQLAYSIIQKVVNAA